MPGRKMSGNEMPGCKLSGIERSGYLMKHSAENSNYFEHAIFNLYGVCLTIMEQYMVETTPAFVSSI